MAEAYIDPSAPLQRLGGAIADAFSAPIQPAAPGRAGPLTLPGAPPPVPAETGTFTPVAPIDPSVNPSMQPVQGSEQYPEGFPPDPRGAADKAAPPQPFPDLQPGFADRQPAFVPQTVTETTRQTTGPDAKTAANINAATADANAAVAAGGQAQVDQADATAALERREAQAQYGRGVNDYFQRAGELQTQDEIIRETSARLEDAAKFKPDRTALFHGDNGTLFGISAAIAAMAGGWLMGQGLTGGKNPYLDVVMRMIDDNANDQIQANSQVYQELTRRLGSAEAAKRELKARMLEATNQTVEAQSRFNKAELVQKGAAVLMADVQREQAKNRLEAAKLTGQTTTKTVQSRTQMVANPAATGGIDLTDPKEYLRVGQVQSIQNLANTVDGLVKSGELAANVGFLDDKWNWVKDKFDARDPGQAKVQAAIDEFMSIRYQAFKTEPNGPVAARLASIGVPRNDGEIPLFQQQIRNVLNEADAGGRYRLAARAMGNRPAAVETRRIPVVQGR